MAESPRKRGAPARLTLDHVERIAASVELGAFISSAVAAEGFSRRAYQRWFRVGREAIKKQRRGETIRPIEAVYALLVERLRVAVGRCQRDATMRMRELGEDDADVLDSFLGKRFPSMWGRELSRKPADEQLSESGRGSIVELPAKQPVEDADDGDYAI